MVNFFRLLTAIFVIAIIVPQNPTENLLLRVLNESRLFPNYSETQNFLNRLIWILIAVFLIITFFADLLYR
jgi:protein translocase SecG subunit